MRISDCSSDVCSSDLRSADEYRDDFLGRFDALVEAQDLAFADQDEPGLMALFERIFAPYMVNPEAVVIQPGAAVELGPRTIMSLSLVLHELATNAAKYGALSVSGGRVQVSRSEEHTSELQSLMRISYAVFCLKK